MPVSVENIVEALNRHRTSLISYAWVVVGDAQLADDVFQDISLAAIRKADQIVDSDHLVPWLRKAVRLRGLEIRRSRSKQGTLLSPEVIELFEDAQTDLTRASESDRMASLRKCIQVMPGNTKNLLKLRYTQDLKPRQIAEKTGKSEQAIYKAIKRVHLRLADCIRQRIKAMGSSR